MFAAGGCRHESPSASSPVRSAAVGERDSSADAGGASAVERSDSVAIAPDADDVFEAEGFNLVFVSMTNTRADHLGCYGYDRPTSPAIDALANRSLVFESVYAPASWTLPVAVSLLTSQYPLAHGLMNRRDAEPLSSSTVTFVDLLRAAGYVCGAFVGDRDYSPVYGHTSRFDTVFDATYGNEFSDWKEYGVFKNTLPAAITWLRQQQRRKFFLFVQGYDTHCPFALPAHNNVFDPEYDGEIDFGRCYWTFKRTSPIPVEQPDGTTQKAFLLRSKPRDGDSYEDLFSERDVQHMVALYDGEILNVDGHVARLLDVIRELDLERRTIVVLFSDHGDMFGKHGRFMRGGPLRGTFYDDVLRVPLIVHHPGLRARRVRGLMEVIDIGPTLLDILGIDPDASFRGVSMRSLIVDGTPVRDAIYAGSAYTPRDRNVFFRHDSLILAVRDARWKLIHERLFYEDRAVDAFELFDMRKDPDELENLVERHPDVVESYRLRLRGWANELGVGERLEAFERGE